MSALFGGGGSDMLAQAAAMAKEKVMEELKPKITEAVCNLIPGYLTCCCIPCNLCCDPEGQISAALALARSPQDLMQCKCINPVLGLCGIPNPVEGCCVMIFGEDGPPSPCFCCKYVGSCCCGEDCMTLAGKFPDIMSGGANLELADLKLLLGICAAAVAVGVAASGADGNPATGATEIQMKGAPKQHWVWAKKRQAGKTNGKLQTRYFTLANGVLSYYEKESDAEPKRSFNLTGFTVTSEGNKVHVASNDPNEQNTEIEFHELAQCLDVEKAQADFLKAMEKHIKFADKSF
jgi:hypothetical protein